MRCKCRAEKHCSLNHQSLKHKRVVFVTTRFVVEVGSRSRLLALLLFFLYFDNFTTFIESAVWTNRVRKAHRATVRAGNEVARLQSIVGAAHVAAAL
jgi:ATP/ADP translocase